MSAESSTFAAESVNGFGCIDTQCIRIKVKQRWFLLILCAQERPFVSKN